MKQIFFLLCLAIFTFLTPSCNDDSGKSSDKLAPSDVPAAVVSAFNAKYPGITTVEWEKAKEGETQTYKAEYKNGEDKMEAEFAADGTFIKDRKDD